MMILETWLSRYSAIVNQCDKHQLGLLPDGYKLTGSECLSMAKNISQKRPSWPSVDTTENAARSAEILDLLCDGLSEVFSVIHSVLFLEC